ncbi:AMP-binding protein [Corynebacterium cystitidis]|uniref:O-succinylbenzoic acid--CoA ligase n=1 Tax=Corynebacterium cystitidis DSM 20524 TaxID=1121357 RepID=A0A1H9VJH2_9CORY|nr:AMP-binding protein [Corynebacterium cystitidis]WJY81430.1 putative sulfoacetate--CoA ligase [Corynebacterium cystitidis DSM 20524]SES21709.1 O-succinylbenzoic acid--CoA ligase [Corynebacterium cystitidis DSM 20524]SNV87498.1 O-succinylbenzoic acid--CoA ligase [Corynebacterium cystitidis]
MNRASHVLEVLPVSLADPTAILPNLEEAIAGARTLLPVPADDRARTDVLKASQRAGEPIDAEIALVVSTSGSTGTPKGAQLTAANLVASADATHQFLGGPGQWLLAMPAHHIAGLQVLVRSLIAGVEPAACDLTGGFNVAEFSALARELNDTGDRCYTSLTPMQLNKAMSTLDGIEALRLFDAILVGGASTSPKLLRAAKELRINVVTTYGSSETSGGCVYNGQPIAGAQIRVEIGADAGSGSTGPDSGRAGAGSGGVSARSGRIHLGGPMIAHGYRNLPEHEAFARDGWFATSDAGSLIDDHLHIAGRIDTIIDSGGLKLHPEVVEKHMLALDGVDSACVIGVPDERLGQRIVTVYSGTATRTDLLEAFEELPRWQVPKEILHVEQMPLIGPGKVDRQEVAALFRM